MPDNYEVYYLGTADSPMFVQQWLQGLLDENLELVSFSEGWWVFRKVYPLVEVNNAQTSYGDFFDKAVIALGYSSAMLPGKEAEDKLLKRISDLFWLVRNLSDALDCIYNKLPAHWRELPFSYHDIKRKVKEVMKNG
jgi:hypothetical protein